MLKTLKLTTLLFALPLFFSMTTPQKAAAATFSAKEAPKTVILDVIVAGIHDLSWTPMAGNGLYTVTAFDLTTNTMHSQFTTSNTSALYYNLTVNHTYRFTVARGSSLDYVVVEILDIG